MSTTVHPFDRQLPLSEFFKTRSMMATLWYACASALLVAQLLLLAVLLALILDHGPVTVAPADAAKFEQLFGQPVPTGAQADAGLLRALWDNRNYLWARPLIAAWKTFPPLQTNAGALSTLVLLLAGMQLVRLLAESRARRGFLKRALEVATETRQSIHKQVLRLGPSDLEGKASPLAFQLFTTEAEKIRTGVYMWLDVLGRDPLRLTLLLLLILCIDPLLTIICLMPLGGCWWLAQVMREKSDAARQLSVALAERDLRLLSESLTKTKLVKNFGMEAQAQAQFEKYLERFQDLTASGLRAGARYRAVVHLLVTVCIAGALFLTGWRSVTSAFTFGAVPSQIALLMACTIAAAWPPLQRLWDLGVDHGQTRQAFATVQTWLDIPPEVEQVVGAKFLPPLERAIELESVGYSLHGRRTLLDRFTAKLAAGKQYAIVSTDPLEAEAFASLLPRFIEPHSGRILFDGEEITWVTLESLRMHVILVSGREPFLTGTITENICAGGKYSLTEVMEAAKLAQAHHFISKLTQGYETVIGEHGEQLDAGQSYRLSLTRAILRKPALLVLQEPTEVIDDETKALLDEAYKKIAPKRTVIYLPQRLTTIRRCDEILMLHKGRLAARGAHADLVNSTPMYRHWEYLKFNEFRHEFETA